ncbi:FecR family protein [Flavitalea flava]
MTDQSSRLHYLLQQYADGDCTLEEYEELFDNIREATANEPLQQWLAEDWERMRPGERYPWVQWDRMFDEIIASTQTAEPIITGNGVKIFNMIWWRIAAVFIAAMLITALAINLHKSAGAPPVTRPEPNYNTVIRPGSNKATLILANGSAILLDSADNGTLAQQGNIRIIKMINGQLAYQTDNGGPQTIKGGPQTTSYNIVNTPVGGQYQLQLSDGTKVWLNASSSLRFPAAFTGSDRQVVLSGEAYFEVAKDPAKPFRVSIAHNPSSLLPGDGGEVEVLGTQFNVNAYADEPFVRTTLREGAVRVSKGKEQTILRPGEQSQFSKEGLIKTIPDADVPQAIAWKDGMFSFNKADLPSVMRQIARWYNVEITYEGQVPAMQFGGKISRNSNVQEVLEILALSKVHFKIEGRKIVVMP